MKTNLEDLSPVKKKMEIEIEAEEVVKKIDEAYRALKKEVKLPGFRPGKAPRSLLERQFGDRVMEDVARRLINETFLKAVEETNIVPLNAPIFENSMLKAGQNFSYSAVMEVRPEFDIDNYIGLEVEKEICSVSDEDVDKQLEEIRKSRGTLTSITEDRGIKENDYAVIEYRGFEDDMPLEGVEGSNILIQVGSHHFHRDFEKALIGLKKGDNSKVKVDFEEDHSQPKLAGKSVRFEVKVEDIQEMNLPDLDDGFAKDVGADFESLDELKRKIKDNLQSQEENRIERELKRRLIDKISEGVDIELPESLVESELDNGIERIKQNLLRSGSTLERVGLDEGKLRGDLTPASKKRIKEMLILEKIARKDDLTIDEAELSEGFEEISMSIGQQPEIIRKYYEANNLIGSFRVKLLEEKTLNYLVENAKIIDMKKVETGKPKQEK
ncbi:MAG: trigger factor [Deltaproteobacteria bacterium]|nr:trigger factor [Deltaproteobacteria bacterium]